MTKYFAFLLLAGVICAQDRPQFVWQGEVDGTDILNLQGKKLRVKVQEGGPVARQRFQFNDPLPDVRQNARLEVREGRGYVHIIDQPRIDNNYTLAVSIEDRQPGSSFYSIAVYWDASSAAFERSGRTDQVEWSGRVDEEAIVSCQAKQCVASAVRGAAVVGEKYKFSKPLPNRDIDVRLESALGRGEMRLVEQPRPENHFTARVAIRDPQAGAGEYSFALVWNRDGGGAAAMPMDASRGLIWTGTVDGRARVTVHGSSSVAVVLEGKPITDIRADFLQPMPGRADVRPVLKKLRGRGKVEIVESPSAANHFNLIFEINGTEGGPDTYEVEVYW